MTRYGWYLGIDWGVAEHHLCLVDAGGHVGDTRIVAHTADAVHAALQWVRGQTGAAPDAIAVGVETPRGVLVDSLVEQGFAVFAINPKQLDRFRDRFSVGGAKDDPRDAHVIADALRTDPRAFRAVRIDDPIVIQLRELSRLGDDLQVDEGRLANRLRDQLYRIDAPWLTLCPAADEAWLWTVLREWPDPTAWATLSGRRLAAILRAHRIRRLSADDIRTVLQRPRLSVAAGVPEAVATRIAALVPQLMLLRDQRTRAERQIDRLLTDLSTAAAPESEPLEHRDAEILLSLPGVGRMVAATMLTEAAGLLATREYATLRAYSGTAPITKRSGKRLRFVQMRYACNTRLRNALHHWARTSIQHDPSARAYYDRLRARGHQHARALRSVGDRWLRILIAMLKTGTVYDPARFVRQEPVTP